MNAFCEYKLYLYIKGQPEEVLYHLNEPVFFCTICRTTYDDLRGKSTEGGEFIAVPKHLLGYVIGKNGNTIKKLQKLSGAMITQTSPSKKPAGFIIRGNESELACAKQLIAEKVVRETLFAVVNPLLREY